MKRPAPLPAAAPLALRIDALVLRGIARAEAAGVAQALQAELARRLAEPVAAGWRTDAAPRLRVQLPAPATGARPEAIGRQIGGALAGSLVPPARGGHGGTK